MFLEVVKQCIETFIVGHNLFSSLSPLNILLTIRWPFSSNLKDLMINAKNVKI